MKTTINLYQTMLLVLASCFVCSSIAFVFLSSRSSNVLICFPKGFPKGEYARLAWYIVWLQFEGNISSLKDFHIYLFLPDNSTDKSNRGL